MSRTFQSITQSNNAQSAEGKGEQHKCKAGNKFSFRNKKEKTGKIATAFRKIAKM